jgi:hypothetical protein
MGYASAATELVLAVHVQSRICERSQARHRHQFEKPNTESDDGAVAHKERDLARSDQRKE